MLAWVSYASTNGPRATTATALCADLRHAHRILVVLQEADTPTTSSERAERADTILAIADQYTTAATSEVVPERVQDNLRTIATLTTRAADALNDPTTINKSAPLLKASTPTRLSISFWCRSYTPPA